MDFQAHSTSASPTVAVTGTTRPMLASPPSTATTPARIVTATSGSVPLSLEMPEGVVPREPRPAQNAKGLLGLGEPVVSPEYEIARSRPDTAGAGSVLFRSIYDFESLYRARDYSRDPNPHNLDRLTIWYAHARYAEPTGMMRRIFATLANQHPANN